MADITRTPRYAAVAIALHWTIAALIVAQVVLAGRMEARTPEAFAVFQLHKSVGITILLLSLARLAWRLIYRPPEPTNLAPWERRLSAAVHWGFYAVMILMPLSGWVMVSTSRIAFPTVLFGAIPWPHLPGLPELAPAAKAAWNETAENAHQLTIKGAYVLFGLHVAGALKHQWLDGDSPVLARMAPGARPGRRLEPRLLVVAAGLVAVVAFAQFYQPPGPAMRAPAPAPAPVIAEIPAPPPPSAPPAVATPAPTGPVRWAVQPGSTLGFATNWSGQPVEGRFTRWTADILFSPDALEGSRIRVAIDVASGDTGDQQRDASLDTSDWLDATAHPKAEFTASRFERTGEGRYVAHGRLTLRGISRPLDLPFRLKIDGDRAEVSGVTSLDRTAFGVGQGEWTNTEQIPAKVTVSVTLKARRS
ncbi:MAG: cytochrome B [Phenylobacterium sp.]|uniref:YceI family protein n=1 Tax=Phenylobacterium sp. TaxID=1871053 RepID=UPI0011F71F17|nr:YceI family protein [Phenylobacterium sp.]TAJ72276.1 MAG: cytochrome B [Phenylobacterium sp.]